MEKDEWRYCSCCCTHRRRRHGQRSLIGAFTGFAHTQTRHSDTTIRTYDFPPVRPVKPPNCTHTHAPDANNKDHLERQHPAQMFYRRPHFTLDALTGDVAAVFWSPAFQGDARSYKCV